MDVRNSQRIVRGIFRASVQAQLSGFCYYISHKFKTHNLAVLEPVLSTIVYFVLAV